MNVFCQRFVAVRAAYLDIFKAYSFLNGGDKGKGWIKKGTVGFQIAELLSLT